MKNFFLILIFGILMILTSCNTCESNKLGYKLTNSKTKNFVFKKEMNKITISPKGFFGEYIGVEFNKDGDVAHQFSNKTAKIIGRYLKDSYKRGIYLKVDFKNTKITTNGLDCKDYVEFKINMPFIRTNKRNAYTGIVHCGTWVNQKISILNVRLDEQLRKLKRISVGNTDQEYFKTPEGYKEYWVQFKHEDYQKI